MPLLVEPFSPWLLATPEPLSPIYVPGGLVPIARSELLFVNGGLITVEDILSLFEDESCLSSSGLPCLTEALCWGDDLEPEDT